MAEDKGLTFPVLHTEQDNDVVWELYLSEGNPSTFLIDREGRIVSYHLGYQQGDEIALEQEIVELLDPTDRCG